MAVAGNALVHSSVFTQDSHTHLGRSSLVSLREIWISMIILGKKASQWNGSQMLLPGNKQIHSKENKVVCAYTLQTPHLWRQRSWVLNCWVLILALTLTYSAWSLAKSLLKKPMLWMGATTPINHPGCRVRPVKHFTDAKRCQSLQTNERHQEAMWQPSSQPRGLNTLTRGPRGLGTPNSQSGFHFLCSKARKAMWTYTIQKNPLQSSLNHTVSSQHNQLCQSWVWFSSTAGHLRQRG